MGRKINAKNFENPKRALILFLTYGENYSGIYAGQVVDVCRTLSEIGNKKVKLIALISHKKYFFERKKNFSDTNFELIEKFDTLDNLQTFRKYERR